MGITGWLVLAGVTPLLVERILNIPLELMDEARTTFHLLALSVPVVLVSGSFQGVMEASQRFDLVNAVKIPTSSLTYFLPLVGLFLGFKLPGIVALILLARLGALVALVILNFRLHPELKRYSNSFKLFPRLFSFGGWVMVSSIISPILVYLERFLIGSLLPISAVAYYSAPYEAVTRLLVIPASLTMTLFPAFSVLEGIKDREKLGTLFARSLKYVLLVMGSIIILVEVFAEGILQIWLGADFVTRSTAVLQILGLGVLINSLAQTPYALLQGIGRPDITAKFHLFELPVYIAIVWFFINRWGITGAAAAWTVRVTLDALLLFGATFKVYKLSLRLLSINGVILTGFTILTLIATAYVLKILLSFLSLFVQLALFVALFGLFAWFTWVKVIDAADKGVILKAVKLWQNSKKTI